MRYICTSIVAVLVLVGTSFAATIHVPGDHATVQNAVGAAADGDVIKIAAGTYHESGIQLENKAITIEGTINNDGSLGTIIDAGCDPEMDADPDFWGCAVFKIIAGEGPKTILRYLIITGGVGTDNIPGNGGGGIQITNSSPRISSCIIRNNFSWASGAGISCINSSASIESCLIKDNEAGGGLSCVVNSSLIITNCTFSGNSNWANENTAAGADIGPYSKAKFAYCIFTDNTQGNINHGVNTDLRAGETSFVTLENCTVCGTGDHVQGLIAHVGENHISDCTDDGDLDGDGDVDADDLSALHAAAGICQSDVNHDGATDINDILEVIAGWNAVCP